MTDFNPLNFIADHAGMNLADAIKEAYEQGKKDAEQQGQKGKWIIGTNHGLGVKNLTCSECGYVEVSSNIPNFCANCGARMLKEGDLNGTKI